MNVYLDVDGVLLANERVLAVGAEEFLVAVLSKYQSSTFWLTTHQWLGEDRTKEMFSSLLRPETLKLMENIKPTTWDKWKTDAIDFSQPFLWFDDDLFPEEKEVLLKNNALDSWVEVNLYKNPTQLKALTEKYFS